MKSSDKYNYELQQKTLGLAEHLRKTVSGFYYGLLMKTANISPGVCFRGNKRYCELSLVQIGCIHNTQTFRFIISKNQTSFCITWQIDNEQFTPRKMCNEFFKELEEKYKIACFNKKYSRDTVEDWSTGDLTVDQVETICRNVLELFKDKMFLKRNQSTSILYDKETFDKLLQKHICSTLHLNEEGSYDYLMPDLSDEDEEDEGEIEINDEQDLRSQFYDYMLQCVKSERKKDTFDTLGLSSADSYMRHAEFDKLYDFDLTKKPRIDSVYSITSSQEILKIISTLLADTNFISKDANPPSQYFRSNAIKQYYWFLKAREFFKSTAIATRKLSSTTKDYNKYLTALRTKPFLLLAGISGTGKSRIVREMAYKSCPNMGDLRADSTTPGNYLMVEVKPNWHDSSELLGYYSSIQSKYMLTPFIKFLVKAKKYPNVPFFVCLDEMNLAPVEQYFAEFLSVLETRKKTGNGIKSGVLVKKEFLEELGETEDLMFPENVFIIGTVNMDDTTHHFSRKVIDRAMTIEMNGGKLEDMFGHSSNLEYPEGDNDVWSMDNELLTQYVNADEVNQTHQMWADKIKQLLPEKLDEINKCLKSTPFEVSYRVLNELCIYLGVLLDDENNVDDAKFDELVAKAVDQIVLMKILPRIEGDYDMFNPNGEENKLVRLKALFAKDTASYLKLDEMIARLNTTEFTRFWP